MLSDSDVQNSRLMQACQRDWVLSVGVTLITTGVCQTRQLDAFLRLFGHEQYLACLGDSLLHQFSQLDAEDERILSKVSPHLKPRCMALLNDLRSAHGVNHQLLASKGLALLLNGHVGFTRFARWAQRLSPSIHGAWRELEHVWSAELWGLVLNLATQKAPVAARLDTACEAFGDVDEVHGSAKPRVRAICQWYSAVEELFSPTPVPAALVRLGKNLLHAQFCWPLQMVRSAGQEFGFSLPVLASLTPCVDTVTKRATPHLNIHAGPCQPHQFDAATQLHGVGPGGLQWRSDWHAAIVKGLVVGKQLWRSQNGRMTFDERQRWLNGALELDFSMAQHAVSWFGPTEHESKYPSFVLEGRSAEAYWAQIVLALLLPQRRIPWGVATATLEDCETQEFRLGPVLGLEAKLRYASQAGFLARMALPIGGETRNALEAVVADQAMRDDLLQSSLCASARDMADVLQTSGWRRAVFLSAPQTRAAFTRLTYDLFSVHNNRIHALPTDLCDLEVRRKVQQQLERGHHLAEQIARGCDSNQSVTCIPWATADDIGFWLALLDHEVRTDATACVQGQQPWTGPGLGVLCLKSRSGESKSRFWAQVFELLHATELLWEKFQLSSPAVSAQALVDLLNNFEADPAISAMPAPDLLVIVDEAGLFVRGDAAFKPQNLLDLSPCPFPVQDVLFSAALTTRDSQRKATIGGLRVLVVAPSKSANSYGLGPTRLPYVALNHPQMDWLHYLHVFQAGFTLHQARAVMDHVALQFNQPTSEWVTFREALNSAVRANMLSHSQGEYFFSDAQKKDRPSIPVAVFDAGLNLAAALSFAPWLVGGSVCYAPVNSSRQLAPTVSQLREASWHLRRVYAFAPNQALQDRARKYLALLDFIAWAQDWDTVKALGRDKRHYGQAGFNLATSLLYKEYDECPGSISANRIAQGINAATQALLQKSMTSEKMTALFDAVQQWASRLPAAISELERTAVQSEQAYFLARMNDLRTKPEFSWGVDTFAKHAEEDINNQLMVQLQRVVAAPIPIGCDWQPGWLQARWHRPRDGWKFAYAGCAINGAPALEPWLRLWATLPMPDQAQRAYLGKIMTLWNGQISDTTAFAWRLRCALAQHKPGSSLHVDAKEANRLIHAWCQLPKSDIQTLKLLKVWQAVLRQSWD